MSARQIIELPEVISAQELVAIISDWTVKGVQRENLRITAGTYIAAPDKALSRFNPGDTFLGVLVVAPSP